VVDWDPRKARSTLRGHNIAFKEAASVLDDWRQATSEDIEHSGSEERWRTIGLSDQARVLVVTWTVREGTVRLISARRATKRERNAYEH